MAAALAPVEVGGDRAVDVVATEIDADGLADRAGRAAAREHDEGAEHAHGPQPQLLNVIDFQRGGTITSFVSRKKIAQLVLLVGVILVGGHFVQSCDHAPVAVEIHYLLGDPPICSGLEVIVEPGGPSGGPAVDHFQTTLIAPDVRQATRLPPGDNTLSITLVAGDARHTVKRTITVVEHAVIRLDLSHETFP